MIERRRWLTVNEFGELMSIHPRSVRRLIARRAVPFVKRKGIGVRLDVVKFEAELEKSEIVSVRKKKS